MLEKGVKTDQDKTAFGGQACKTVYDLGKIVDKNLHQFWIELQPGIAL